MFHSLFAGNGGVEYNFGEHIVAMRTKQEVVTERGGCWFHRVTIRRLGGLSYFTGEVFDPPEGMENPYRGVVFWYLLSEVEQMREYTNREAALESLRAYERWSRRAGKLSDADSTAVAPEPGATHDRPGTVPFQASKSP